jgi:outer membrane protein TolC
MIAADLVSWLSFLPLLVLSPTDPEPPSAWEAGPINPAPVCVPGDAFERVSLSRLWSDHRDVDPGYVAVEERIEAERATRASARREWLPAGSFDGLGNHGQRLSPGEERVLGVGPRGELRLLASWTLLDSDRARRGEVAEARIREGSSDGESFRATREGLVAQVYVQAAVAEVRWEATRAHVERLEELAELVRMRVEAGVEVGWEDQLLQEALARGRRLAAEAELARDAARNELSHLAGRCVRAEPIAPETSAPLATDPGERSPEVQQLHAQAETTEALARQAADQGRWQVQVIGTVGPNYSRAFDDGNVENEYLVGIAARWQPDLAGVRRQLAAAEGARARALRAEAGSLRMTLERELGRIRIGLDQGGRRLALLSAELDEARRREEAALHRWREGVDRWIEVVQARDRVLEVRLLEAALNEELATALVRAGEMTGTLPDVPGHLGQEVDR